MSCEDPRGLHGMVGLGRAWKRKYDLEKEGGGTLEMV